MIVLMAGLPASGKSTLCRALAMQLSGTVLDKDIIRAALFSPHDIEYSTAQDDFSMKIMLETASYILRKDPSRIIFLDGRPFSRTYQIDQVTTVAKKLNQEWRILECVCSEGTARQRLAGHTTQGEHPAANRDFDLYLRLKTELQEIPLPKATIDTDQSPELCIQDALQALS